MEDKIKTRFNKSSNTYDNACAIQQMTNTALLKFLLEYIDANNPIDTIADLGCGTGNSTQLLTQTFKYQQLHAVDIAEQSLTVAKNKLKAHNVKFMSASFNYPLTLTSLDLAYANMSLHWATNLKKTLDIVCNSLKTKGLFSFSCPMDGTLNEIKSTHKNIFLPLQTIESTIQQSTFDLLAIHQKTFVDKFPSPYQALNSIKRVGANILLQQKKKGLSGKNLVTSIFKEKDVFDLTYQVGFFILKKQV